MKQDRVTYELAAMAEALEATRGNRDEAIEKLVNTGGNELRSALGVDLLPIAFGWAAMEKMGIQTFPESLLLRAIGVEDVDYPIAECPLFLSAHNTARDIFENGFTDLFPQSVVQLLCFLSADVKALTKALDRDKSLNVSELEFTSILFGYSPDEIRAAHTLLI